MTTENEKLTHYELGPGAIFIAPGDVPKGEAAKSKYFAGHTDGGVCVNFRENVYPIRDMSGETVCEIHCGARVEVKGKLASVSPSALALLFGARRASDGSFTVCGEPQLRSVGVSVVCPICGSDDEFLLYRRASAQGGSIKLDAAGEDRVEFSIVSERDFGRSAATFSLCPSSERRGA